LSIARKVKRAGTPRPKPNGEMVFVAGGEFTMGSDHHYEEERPAHRVRVDGFFIDKTPVTNAEFRRFVKETGHVTFAEIAPDPKDYPGALPHMLQPGSLVFVKSQGPVDLTDWSNWWTFGFGADWKHPYGPGSTNKGLDDYPVVHISYRDAEVYAKWAGKELPTETEWEFAARGGPDDAEYRAGRQADGQHLAGRVPVAEPDVVEAVAVGREDADRRGIFVAVGEHDRQCVGVDHGLVRGKPQAAEIMLHAGERRTATIPTSRRSGSRAR
jgi:formylglycine-generating enzyme